MKTVTETYDVGVVVGRFQVPELHAAHKELISSVVAEHGKVIIVLGKSPLVGTRKNPLDFEARKQMILQEYPTVTVIYNHDQKSDEVWSKNLDGVVSDLLMPEQTAVLYGSRDSFIGHYSGRFPTRELTQTTYVSGTEIRNQIAAASTVNSVDFRRGAVHAAYGRYRTCFTTVDIAVLSEDGEEVLLARKKHEDRYRFIGGFSDPKSSTFQADARREVDEEAHIAITDPEFLDSFKIDDWRYRGELDCIKTMFFKAKLLSGRPEPDDDIVELQWFDLAAIKPTQIVEEHHALMKCLLDDAWGFVAQTCTIDHKCAVDGPCNGYPRETR